MSDVQGSSSGLDVKLEFLRQLFLKLLDGSVTKEEFLSLPPELQHLDVFLLVPLEGAFVPELLL